MFSRWANHYNNRWSTRAGYIPESESLANSLAQEAERLSSAMWHWRSGRFLRSCLSSVGRLKNLGPDSINTGHQQKVKTSKPTAVFLLDLLTSGLPLGEGCSSVSASRKYPQTPTEACLLDCTSSQLTTKTAYTASHCCTLNTSYTQLHLFCLSCVDLGPAILPKEHRVPLMDNSILKS